MCKDFMQNGWPVGRLYIITVNYYTLRIDYYTLNNKITANL